MCFDSLCTFRGYDPIFDHYSLYIENKYEKIMLTIAFNYSPNFSKAFDKFRRVFTTIIGFMCMCSYLHSPVSFGGI